jgi:hypothetical protein
MDGLRCIWRREAPSNGFGGFGETVIVDILALIDRQEQV